MSDTSSTHVSFEIPTSEPERQASDEFEMALQQTEFIRQQSSVILGLTGEAEGGVGCDSSSNAESDGDDDGDKKPASADAGDTQETPIPKLAPEIAATTDASPGLIPGVHYEVQDSQPLLGKEYLESRKHVEEDKNETSLLAAPSSGTHGNCPTYEEKGYEPASVATDPGDASIAKASEGSVNLTEKQPGAFKMLGSCLQEENGKDVPSMESTSDFSLIEAGNEEEKAKSGEQEGTVCQLRDDNNAQSSEEQSEVAGAQEVASSQEEGLVVAAVLSPGEVGEEDIEAIVQERLKEERRNAAARPSIVATATKVRLEEEGIVLVPKKLLFFFSALFVALLVIAVGFGFAKKKRDGKSSARYDDGVYEVPTLEAIEERGRIICRIWPEEEIKGSGFSIDLVRICAL